MTHGRYLVSGRRRYRGHETGTIFEARIHPNAEQRAVARGDIVLLERITPGLEPGSYMLPHDWPPPVDGQQPEAPQGASST